MGTGLVKPGAGQGSPLRVAPPVQKILRRTLFLVWCSGVVRLERRILDIVDTFALGDDARFPGA